MNEILRMKPHEFSLKYFSQNQLEAMLRTVQLRLGTSAEQPDDLNFAQFIAHQLNNSLTATRLREACDGGEME